MTYQQFFRLAYVNTTRVYTMHNVSVKPSLNKERLIGQAYIMTVYRCCCCCNSCILHIIVCTSINSIIVVVVVVAATVLRLTQHACCDLLNNDEEKNYTQQ